MRNGAIKLIVIVFGIVLVVGTPIAMFIREYIRAHKSGYWNSRSDPSWNEGSREWISLGLSRGATEEMVERAIAGLCGGAKVEMTLRHQVLASEPGKGYVDIFVVQYPSAQCEDRLAVTEWFLVFFNEAAEATKVHHSLHGIPDIFTSNSYGAVALE